LSALGHGIQQGLAWDDHQFVILGRLPSHQAMHGQQTSDFFHRHAAIGIRLDTETRRPGRSFAQNKTLRGKWGMLILRFIGLFSSAYQWQPHSFQSKPGKRTNFIYII
jgi:hypothetical protein